MAGTGVQIQSWDFLYNENRTAHNTIEYSTRELVVRRADPFKIILVFNVPIQSEDITFTVKTGPAPSVHTKTLAMFSASSASGNINSWSAVRGQSGSNNMTITITSPSDAIMDITL
ncbi:protein-glutamine gamma-glutamyltransferase E-like [Microcaecilia unicolor]|uniref:Protein-glutamine gamma-glutamyltransferase E-like n=1 Tax=Microcaecilia unicolor TaxID=1415580 RepID=A0A6P7YQ05_9AMPH|nr:protein-glutamine gamma-glutamyltransferase E-like [Microcaecilia unicolor]